MKVKFGFPLLLQIFCPTACLCPVTMFGGSFMNSWFDMNLSGHSGFQERLDILKAANVSYELVDRPPSFSCIVPLMCNRTNGPQGAIARTSLCVCTMGLNFFPFLHNFSSG